MVQTHDAEIAPFRAYQNEQQRLLLESFAQELGIRKGSDIKFEGRDVKNMHFVCAQPLKKNLNEFRKKKRRARAGKKSA
jgi:hypothetical protein